MSTKQPFIYFADPSTLAPRLQLNTDDGWRLGQGLDLGGLGLEETVLFNETEDDEEVISTRRPRSVMTIPVILTQQATVAAIVVLQEALTTELDRETNAIVYVPHGTNLTYVYDTYRAAVPSLIRGQALLTDCLRHDSEQMPLVIRRRSASRVAGTHL